VFTDEGSTGKDFSPCKTFARGLLTTFGTLQKGCPNYTQRGNLCAIPLKKVKFKVKNQEAINRYKNYQRFIFK
jgi:hypothetical protein